MHTDTTYFVDRLIGQAPGLTEATDTATFMGEFRQKAIRQLRQIGFPDTKVEDWKYTNVQPWLKRIEVKDMVVTTPITRRTFSEQFDAAVRIVTKNGRLDKGSSSAELPTGLHVSSFTDAVQNGHPQFKSHFGKLTNQEEHFSAANAALFEDGLFVYVTPDAVIDNPIHIVHKISQPLRSFLHPRQLIVIGENAKLIIVETFESDEGSTYAFVNSMCEMLVSKQAVVKHYLINLCDIDVASVYNLEVQTAEESQYDNFNFLFSGSPLIRNNIHVVMKEGSARTTLSGLYIAVDDQLVDNHTCAEHKVADCRSDEKYKGILHGSSTAVFNGKIIVHPGAQHTAAYQQNNNLIMDDRATIYTKPELQIFADDVQCTHGATIGDFDQHALFYLQSRGIPEESCLAMLMQAFAFDIIDQIRQAGVKKYITALFMSFLQRTGNSEKTC